MIRRSNKRKQTPQSNLPSQTQLQTTSPSTIVYAEPLPGTRLHSSATIVESAAMVLVMAYSN